MVALQLSSPHFLKPALRLYCVSIYLSQLVSSCLIGNEFDCIVVIFPFIGCVNSDSRFFWWIWFRVSNVPCRLMYSNSMLLACSTLWFQILIRLDLRGSCSGSVLLVWLWSSTPVVSVVWSFTPVCLTSSISSSSNFSTGSSMMVKLLGTGSVTPVINVACIVVKAVPRIGSVAQILLFSICYMRIRIIQRWRGSICEPNSNWSSRLLVVIWILQQLVPETKPVGDGHKWYPLDGILRHWNNS